MFLCVDLLNPYIRRITHTSHGFKKPDVVQESNFDCRVAADALSRWDLISDPPHAFCLADRVSISLDALWTSPLSISLHPVDAHIMWKIPS